MDYQDDLTARRREALWRQLGVYTQRGDASKRADYSDNSPFWPRTLLTQLTPRRQEELEESFACYRVDQRQRDTLPAAVAFVLIGVIALLWMFL